ncbi:hypothetical protein QFW77_10090 [Luteimonas sp. RD2P54]|uniref:Uncharacterized protein n=1 Tax=Luteimonas endophytica TaxID=3042023 RepID=A0ABT6JAY0_9GAMM|nr:hypothetical protein [Luteimonas endophytica]MDH5823333.1 hypothetical protein [Luteimonas endophytica]
MEISQRRNANRIRFAFGQDELQYSLEDRSGSRSFSVPYIETSRDRQTLVERNQWLGNVGLLWLAIGAVLTAASFAGEGGGSISIWLWVGAACYAIYRYRVTRFTIVPSDKGNLLVIDDTEGERILQEIASRRADQFRREYDFMPEGESPDQHRSRFKWLHREGALSDEELEQRLAAIRADETNVGHPVRPESSSLLN